MHVNQIEVWKPVLEFEGLYEVSNYGRVYSARRSKFLHQYQRKDGYKSTRFGVDGKKFSPLIHRLVAEAFIGKIEKSFQVNHIDGDKSNNHLCNLEIVTASENQKHKYDVLGHDRYFNAKYSEDTVLEIVRLRKKGIGVTEISRMLGMSNGNVSLILSGKTRSNITGIQSNSN